MERTVAGAVLPLRSKVRDDEVKKQLPALLPLLQLACPSKFWRPVRSVFSGLTLPPCSFH